jgi:hypothetical protein
MDVRRSVVCSAHRTHLERQSYQEERTGEPEGSDYVFHLIENRGRTRATRGLGYIVDYRPVVNRHSPLMKIDIAKIEAARRG